MKKVKKFWLMLILISCLLLTACAGPTPTTPSTPNPPPLKEEWSADGIIEVREYHGSNVYGDYEIYWRSDDQFVYMGMKAKTTGFVAVGIQSGSRMKDADMIFGFVKDGETTILDMFSTGDFGPHPPDMELGGTGDITEYGGSEEDGVTTIEFKRALDTGDKYDTPLSQGTNKIIWSFGSSDEITRKHTNRGYGEIDL